MRWIVLVVLSLALPCSAVPHKAPPAPLTLASHGRSRYVIVVADDAPPADHRAAAELQRFVRQMSGARLPIVSDRAAPRACEIIVGGSSRLRALGIQLDRKRLGAEGYLLRTVGRRLVIAGGEPRGTLYGVYGLLEERFGCRWFTPTVSRVPRHETLRVPTIDHVDRPAFEYRDPDVFDGFDADWSARNRVNGSKRLDASHGGHIAFGRGLGVHTFGRLLPAERWFAEHPDWYMAGADGRRHPEQLCFTNDEAIGALADALLTRIRSDPAQVFSVSQNDNDLYCECARCAALAASEESQSGPLLYLVNRVADRVAREFPDRSIETLAYAFTRKPPKTIRPGPNVIVRLCSFECCFSHSLEGCDSPRNRPFAQDLRDWQRACRRLWVWNYETSFAHYLLPFPNYRVWQPNLAFFARCGVRGVYTQDNNVFAVGELNELGAYVRAKLMWNPRSDARRATTEFLAGVYGRAAGPLRRYLDLLTNEVTSRNIHVTIWETPDALYLTDAVLANADNLWDQAEAAVADNPAQLARVRLARISPDYAIVERLRVSGVLATHRVDHARFAVLGPTPALMKRIERLRRGLKTAGVRMMGEGRVPLAEYLRSLDALPLPLASRTLEPTRPVAVTPTEPGLYCSYYTGEWEQLPDFRSLQPTAVRRVAQIDIAPRQREEAFGLSFSGYFRARRSGLYAFTLRSNDGSRLWTGDRLVTDNDGSHLIRTRTGCIALHAGLHPIRVDYFQAKRAMGLEVLVQGPGLPRQTMPRSLLWRTTRSAPTGLSGRPR